MTKTLSPIEEDILITVKNLKEPSLTQIRRRCGACIFTVKKVCKLLVENGYLTVVRGNRYTATEEKFETSLSEPKQKIDNELIKKIAADVAEEITKQIKGKSFIAGQEKEIKIKTDYDFPIEDESINLKSNINKIGVKLEREKSDIDKSVGLFKNLRRGR